MGDCKKCVSEKVCRYNDGHNLYCKEDYECPHFFEVVRCKDCVNFKSISNPKYCTKHMDDWGDGEIYTDEDDYCSYGERRSENES